MHTKRLYCCTLAILAAPLAAQEQGGPAPQVAKFHQLLGTWTGSGTVVPELGADPMKWTATSVNTKVLGGHFVQEDVHIAFEGEQAPPPLAFRTLYGFDASTGRSMGYAISNMGTAEARQIHWVDGKMMSGGSKVEKNMAGVDQFICERWSVTFEGDTYKIIGYETIGNSKPFTHVSGTFTRQKIVNASFNPAKILPMMPAAKQMEPLGKWRGSYRMTGWMVMAPGAPKTDIAASEEVSPVFGGSVIEFRLKGDPIPEFGVYEGYGAMAWSPRDQCYKSLWCDNMGSAALVDAHLKEGGLVSGMTKTAMGQHVVLSSIMTLADDGSPAAILEYSSFNGAKPIQTFQGTYTKK